MNFHFQMLLSSFILTIINELTVESTGFAEGKCIIKIDHKDGDLPEPQPLLLTNESPPKIFYTKNCTSLKSTNNFHDWEQPKSCTLEINQGQTILLSCAGHQPGFVHFKHHNKDYAQLKCLSGKNFWFDNGVHDISKFQCAGPVVETVKESSEPCPGRLSQKYLIGFAIRTHFVRLIEICRDEETLGTLFTKFRLVKEIESSSRNVSRHYFQPSKLDPLYLNVNVSKVYSRYSQLNTFEQLLGSKLRASKYLFPNHTLHRGHLAAKADFVYASQQLATMWYLNVVPQWSFANVNNWLSLEISIRDFAARKSLDLDVYTGAHDVLTLKDVNNNDVPMYLYANGSSRQIPVPRFMWKIISDPVNKRATAFVLINDPRPTQVTQDVFLCRDIGDSSKNFDWVTWKSENPELGLSYICRVKDLRKIVTIIPDLEEVDLLY